MTLATVPEGVPVSPRTLKTLKELEAQSSEAKATAFQHLLLLVGIHLFKVWRPGREGLTDLGSAVARRGSPLLESVEVGRFPRLTAPAWNYSPRTKSLHPLTGPQLHPELSQPVSFVCNPHSFEAAASSF